MSESRLSHYLLLNRIGEGGMGTVYLARDERLGRTLAIKTLRDGGLADSEQRRRFVQEAQAASALNHPNIVTVYDIGRDGEEGLDFIAMEYVEGEQVADLLARGDSGVELALRIGIPVASALAAAHAAGIVHRDLKPANVMQTASGLVKLLDFGLAKLTEAPTLAKDVTTRAQNPQTATGVVLGTPAYMAPEQIEGRAVDARTDVFALGLLLYELLSGRRAFQSSSTAGLMSAILRDRPEPVARYCGHCPKSLVKLLEQCLQKNPAQRPADAGEVLVQLRRIEANWRQRSTLSARLLRPAVLLPVLGIMGLLLAVLAWQSLQARKEAAARAQGIAELHRLTDIDHEVEAYGLLRQLASRFPQDPELAQWWSDLSLKGALRSEPPGARFWIKAYPRPESEWIELGQSNQEPFHFVMGHVRWRVEMEGYQALERATRGDIENVVLTPSQDAPDGMVRVAGGEFGRRGLAPATLEPFWLDRAEVTNAQFQAFVDAGGYERPEFWTDPMQRDGQILDFGVAMVLFRDSTGRPGPAGWELGRHPDGQGEHPVAGVSWFEAMAYARFVGKSLPTAHHWMRAAGHDLHSDVLNFSNFDGQGTVPVASREALSPFGNHDLAGNVAEWVVTGRDTHRLALGGHWASPTYLFNDLDGEDPFVRSPHIGFRCARIDALPSPALLSLPDTAAPDFPPPVSDDVFAVLARQYAHDPAREPPRMLDDVETEHWRLQTWLLQADYNGESFRLRLYLPRNASPPYQVLVYGPPAVALLQQDIKQTGTRDFAFLPRSGRALAFPEFYGTYSRRMPSDAGPQARRAMRPNWSKDAGRVMDFLQTRPELDAQRIGYYGVSLGANAGITMLAVEPRFAVGILQASGLSPQRTAPEIDAINFAPRIRQPVLMIGGRHDFMNPLETSQQPLFDRLGTAPEDKSMFLFDGGHVPPRQQEIMGVILDWLDQHLGPVESER